MLSTWEILDLKIQQGEKNEKEVQGYVMQTTTTRNLEWLYKYQRMQTLIQKQLLEMKKDILSDNRSNRKTLQLYICTPQHQTLKYMKQN